MTTRFEKYWTESGRGDGQGDVAKKDHQSYRRPDMMGKARGKVSKYVIETVLSSDLSDYLLLYSITHDALFFLLITSLFIKCQHSVLKILI